MEPHWRKTRWPDAPFAYPTPLNAGVQLDLCSGLNRRIQLIGPPSEYDSAFSKSTEAIHGGRRGTRSYEHTQGALVCRSLGSMIGDRTHGKVAFVSERAGIPSVES